MEVISGLFGLAFGGFWLVFVCLSGLLGVASTVLWIWVLVEVLTKETSEENTKLIWVLVIVLTGWIGALIYLFVRRPERVKKLGR